MANTTLTFDDPFPPPLEEDSRATEALDFLGVLGAGGMAIVHLAHQRSVDRPVAVKTLQEDDNDDVNKGRLVREGWVLGQLDHPNIPPIYSITTHNGRPAIVFKRILGERWSTYLETPGLLQELHGGVDELSWHLEVMFKVIDAVSFAHQRGILHRDLKPSNVMIGRAGEVYLMDWGLAVSMRPEDEGAVQLARDVVQTEGTYVYMAPEMLEPRVQGITARTDVYQLGCMLYQMCMRRPPHTGSDWAELDRCIRDSNPVLNHGVPTELGSIIRRAMRARPEQRFEDADGLRAALEEFQRHRRADAYSAEGEGLLAQVANEANMDCSACQRSGDCVAHRRIGLAEFEFRRSLEIWPENARALRGLDECRVDLLAMEGQPSPPRSFLDAHAIRLAASGVTCAMACMCLVVLPAPHHWALAVANVALALVVYVSSLRARATALRDNRCGHSSLYPPRATSTRRYMRRRRVVAPAQSRPRLESSA